MVARMRGACGVAGLVLRRLSQGLRGAWWVVLGAVGRDFSARLAAHGRRGAVYTIVAHAPMPLFYWGLRVVDAASHYFTGACVGQARRRPCFIGRGEREKRDKKNIKKIIKRYCANGEYLVYYLALTARKVRAATKTRQARKGRKRVNKMVVHDYITPLQREIINGFGGGKIIDKPEGVWIPSLVALELSEIAERGIENACPDAYMYYEQTWDFFAAHRKAIIAALAEQAEEGMYGEGVTTALGAVTRFSCFDNWEGGKEVLVEIAAQMFYLPIEEAAEVDGALYLVQMIVWGLIEDTANAIDWYLAMQGKAEAEAVTA